ncbi:hypothetical protein [Streptomyces sp. CCM_MD2014]|uniref:hypothetical protein n=1 Tax=Streptomyces sp. CCM_MD2014 TaxID=1561022 RepID=UPI00052AF0CB|nr:hypothetical protein [Streptomyces sp. CCM_MD2014]AIV35593.1 hypothetical protein NI25_20545 [Streptomyces sp. CCM_MD2014]
MSNAPRCTAYYQGGVQTANGTVDTLLVTLPDSEDQNGDSSPSYHRLSTGEWTADDMVTANGWTRLTEWEPVPGEDFHQAKVQRTPAPQPVALTVVRDTVNAEITVSAHGIAPADLDALTAAVEDAAAPYRAIVNVSRD